MSDKTTQAWHPATSRPRHAKTRTIAIIGVVLILLFALVASLPVLTRPFRDSNSARAIGAILPNAEFLSDFKDRTDVYAIEDGKFVTRASGPLVIASVMTTGGTFRVVRAEDGMYEIRNGEKLLLRSKVALTGLDATPDGTYLTYAQQSEDAAPLPIQGGLMQFQQLKTREWNVIVLQVATNVGFSMGEGVQPFFLDGTHIARTTSIGIYASDIKTGETKVLLARPFSFVSFTPLVSPDRTRMGAQVDDSKSVSVFKVSLDGAEEIASIPLIDRITSYAIGNGELYMLRTEAFGTEVWRHSFEPDANATLEGDLPEILHMTRVSTK